MSMPDQPSRLDVLGFRVPGDIEVSAAAGRSNLGEDTHVETVEQLFGLVDVAAVARIYIYNCD
jgi:hypothetical protein